VDGKVRDQWLGLYLILYFFHKTSFLIILMFDNGRIVKRGTCLYAESVICDLCIQKTDIRYGSADYEDPPEIREDIPGDWFYIWYTSAGARGQFNNGGGCFPSLEEAINYAESHFSGVHWEK
jgi:hypothetical protein